MTSLQGVNGAGEQHILHINAVIATFLQATVHLHEHLVKLPRSVHDSELNRRKLQPVRFVKREGPIFQRRVCLYIRDCLLVGCDSVSPGSSFETSATSHRVTHKKTGIFYFVKKG